MADIKKLLESMNSISGLHIGDPVVITGDVQHKGETGDVVGFNQDNSFVIVDLYNHGRKSFHSSDVSYNDYVDPDHDEDMYVPEDKFAGEKVGQKPSDQVRGTEKAKKKKSGDHPFKGRLVGASESILKDLSTTLKDTEPKRDLAEEFSQFKDNLDEFAKDPKYWRDDEDPRKEFTNMSLANIANVIMQHIGDEFTVEKGKRKDQPSYKFVPKDRTKFGMARIWCGYDRRGGEYPTYHTNLYSYYSEPSGRVIASGKMVEKLVRKNNANAMHTAELIYGNTDGALKQTMSEESNPADALTLDVPLMIRLLEYAREDAKTDMDLHNVAERMIELSAEGRTLTMQDYDAICAQQKQVGEAKGLKKRVRIVQGSYKGRTGTIGEVRHGLFKGAPKKYTIDLDGGGNVMLPGEALRLIKDSVEEQVAGTPPNTPAGTGTMASTGTAAPKPATAQAQQTAQTLQQTSNLQKNIAQLKTAGVNVDPARAAQTLQKTDTGAPMTAQDKDTIAKMAPALGNVLGRPDLTQQLNTLIKKAGGAQ